MAILRVQNYESDKANRPPPTSLMICQLVFASLTERLKGTMYYPFTERSTFRYTLKTVRANDGASDAFYAGLFVASGEGRG